MTVEIKGKYFLENSEQEAHFTGDYIAVCWNYDTDDDGKNPTRSGKPYISFIALDMVTSFRNKYYADDDSSIDGGINSEQAKQIIKELQLAVEYMESL